MKVPPKTTNASGTQAKNALLRVRRANAPATYAPATSMTAYQNVPPRTAAAAGTPSAASTAVKLYCVSRVISDSA